ncbi:MAG TPA: hypothetical protein ENH00_08830 [Actinobacteria bacterium]|nr:hypothetical protein [Actinomycetota bacterium]
MRVDDLEALLPVVEYELEILYERSVRREPLAPVRGSSQIIEKLDLVPFTAIVHHLPDPASTTTRPSCRRRDHRTVPGSPGCDL